MSALLTLDGNITADPELRYTQAGVPVSTFNVATTPRRLNRDTQQWEDAGATLFLRVNVWREQAEHVAATLRKGNAVQVIGRLVSRPWQDKDGNDRVSTEVEADIVSLDLRRQRVDAANVQRVRREQPGDAAAGSDWSPAPLRSDARTDSAAA